MYVCKLNSKLWFDTFLIAHNMKWVCLLCKNDSWNIQISSLPQQQQQLSKESTLFEWNWQANVTHKKQSWVNRRNANKLMNLVGNAQKFKEIN